MRRLRAGVVVGGLIASASASGRDDPSGAPVFAAVRDVSADVRACARGTDAKDGFLVLTWTVTGERAHGVVVESNPTGSRAVGRCAVRVVRRTRFAGAEDGEVRSSIRLAP